MHVKFIALLIGIIFQSGLANAQFNTDFQIIVKAAVGQGFIPYQPTLRSEINLLCVK
jgi:hypothetical protein